MAKRVAIYSTGANWDDATRQFLTSPSEASARTLANRLTGHTCNGFGGSDGLHRNFCMQPGAAPKRCRWFYCTPGIEC